MPGHVVEGGVVSSVGLAVDGGAICRLLLMDVVIRLNVLSLMEGNAGKIMLPEEEEEFNVELLLAALAEGVASLLVALLISSISLWFGGKGTRMLFLKW